MCVCAKLIKHVSISVKPSKWRGRAKSPRIFAFFYVHRVSFEVALFSPDRIGPLSLTAGATTDVPGQISRGISSPICQHSFLRLAWCEGIIGAYGVGGEGSPTNMYMLTASLSGNTFGAFSCILRWRINDVVCEFFAGLQPTPQEGSRAFDVECGCFAKYLKGDCGEAAEATRTRLPGQPLWN